MRARYVLPLFFLVANLPLFGAIHSESEPIRHEIDLGFKIKPGDLHRYRVFGASDPELDEVIRVGARALEWGDILQSVLVMSDHEQVWRGIDQLNSEPDPEHPMHYNREIVLDLYRNALATAPATVVAVLVANTSLPKTVPNGLTLAQVMSAIRRIDKAYSDASRWIALSPWRNSMPKDRLDLRGWLRIHGRRVVLISMAERWSSLSREERARFVDQVAEACPVTGEGSVEKCRRENHDLIGSSKGGASAGKWLVKLLALGQTVYNSKFGVQVRHPGVRLVQKGSSRWIELPSYGIDPDTFSWIKDCVQRSWVFGDSIGVKLYSAGKLVEGAVQVNWEQGELPHVDSVGGDTITMDSNTPKWLEQTQAVMSHEMGHVLGFPDCYTEFWDADRGVFTYYSLDPDDAMCALSGRYLDRHRDALIRGYF